MNSEEIEKVLDSHQKWINEEDGGEMADLREANLSRADLSGADLHWADLREAELSEADLHGAKLHGAKLHWANLRAADLRGADLSGADLRWADLHGAELSEADLRGAVLSGATLHEANLRGANLDFSCFPLCCGGSKFQCDIKLIYQLLAHICTLEFDDTEGIKELIMPFAAKSHRAVDLGLKEESE